MFDSAIRNPDRVSVHSAPRALSKSHSPVDVSQNRSPAQVSGKGQTESNSHSSASSATSEKSEDGSGSGIAASPNSNEFPEHNGVNNGASTNHNSSSRANSTNTTSTTADNNNTITGIASRILDEELSRRKKNLRRKHRNSHLGCGTCKKRRIKCDEMLPQCFNCVKGKLHCAYLNLDAPARSALRMAQYNQNMRADPPEELAGSYYKEYQTDATHAHRLLIQMQPVIQQAVAAAPSEYFPAGYVPYQLVPQMVNGAPVSASSAAAGMVPSMYRPMVLIQQPVQQPGKAAQAPTVMYSQVPVQMVSATHIPQVMYQHQEQMPMHLVPKPGLVHMAPMAPMEGLPMMVLKSPGDAASAAAYESSSSPSAMGSAAHSRPSISGPFLNQSMAQIPRLYPPGVTPVIMSHGAVAHGGMVQQIAPGGPYQMAMHQQLSPVPQLAQTPLFSLLHHAGQVIGHPGMAGVSVSPMVKPMLTPSGALYYATPIMLSAPILERQMSSSGPGKHEPEIRVKTGFVKSEYTTEFEKEAEKKKRYNTDSPEPINESEKVPSIKMLLS